MNGKQLLDTAQRILRLVAVANPETAGFVAAVSGARTLLNDILIPEIRKAVERRELTAEEEASLRRENDDFWGSIESGAAFTDPRWQPRPRPDTGG